MNIIVDTNIVISAPINDRGKIGQLLLNKPADIHFFSPRFLLHELDIHHKKILKLTEYTPDEYLFVRDIIIASIEFIDEKFIETDIWQEAYSLLIDIDEKDTSFLAFSIKYEGLL